MFSQTIKKKTRTNTFGGDSLVLLQVAPQHLHKDLPELAEVEECVSHRMEGDVAMEVGGSPAGFGDSCHHKSPNLVGEPANHQGPHNET
uniref:Uncharacterized protein n=1 Tax=Sphaeramia orbicularis TaxID=375764 RepID=A0A673B5D3_9TELE